MYLSKIIPYILSTCMLGSLCMPSGCAADGVSNVGPTESYTIVSEELQDTVPSWELSKVYNTKRGIMIKYSGLSAEHSFQIIHCKKNAALSSQYLCMDSWFSGDSEDEPYGQLRTDSNGLYRFLDIDCKNGQSYQYKVAYHFSSGTTLVSDEVTIYRLNQPTITAINTTKQTVSIQWARNPKASGYQVRYATKSDFSNKKLKTISGNRNTTFKLKNRTPGKQYYMKVRSYKVVNGIKYYSAWSDVCQRY